MNWFTRLFSGPEETPPPRPSLPRKGSFPKHMVVLSPRRPFPYPVVAVPGEDAVAEWRRLNEMWRKEGATAVLVGDAKQAADRADAIAETPGDPDFVLGLAYSRTPPDFFARRDLLLDAGEDMTRVDPWPADAVPTSEVCAHLDVLSREPKQLVYFAKLPTAKPWEVPAYLMAGGWNDCPTPEDQVVALKHWAQKYDIEVFSLTDDIMECFVGRPPQTEADALALAREQFLFCSDIIYQGTETVTALAAGLKGGRTWYFWWD